MWCFRIKEMRVPGIARALSLCVCVRHCYVSVSDISVCQTPALCVCQNDEM